MKTIFDFKRAKELGEKISMITCYDYTQAAICNNTEIDCILVGDSSAMVSQGFATTIPATIEMQVVHTASVARGASNKFIIGDLPFLSYRISRAQTMQAVADLIRAGAGAVKLEGAKGNLETIAYIVESGVPVMGHIGLTPQAFHQLGGFRVQGKTDEAKAQLLQEARALEKAGCFALVLECVPSDIAGEITRAINIPTIGIGAGNQVDGQVLVWQDLLGLNPNFKAKFVKQYLNGYELIVNALNHFDSDVKSVEFPRAEHTF